MAKAKEHRYQASFPAATWRKMQAAVKRLNGGGAGHASRKWTIRRLITEAVEHWLKRVFP